MTREQEIAELRETVDYELGRAERAIRVMSALEEKVESGDVSLPVPKNLVTDCG